MTEFNNQEHRDKDDDYMNQDNIRNDSYKREREKIREKISA